MKKLFIFILTGTFSWMYANSSPIAINPFNSYSPSSGEQIRSSLFLVEDDATTTLMDGDLTQYDPSYSNGVDGMDARKMNNYSENLGMEREEKMLVIERRKTIEITDTIFYKMWNLRQRTYQLTFVTINMDHPGLKGYLEDRYLNTSTPISLNGTSSVNFSVNSDPASSDPYRFRLVFSSIATGTITYTNAFEKNNDIILDWKTQDETNIKKYSIEKSADGILFNPVADIQANNLPVNDYSWTDVNASDGYNYYRVQSTDVNGVIKYSMVVKVYKEKSAGKITVFPNPIANNTIHIKIENQLPGIYVIRLINNYGQQVMVKKIQHTGGNSLEIMRPELNISKGQYHLEVIEPGGSKMSIRLMY